MPSRTPDIKHNLDISNGTFGVVISLGVIGAVLAFMFVGQLVHRVGVGATLIGTSLLLYGPMLIIPHIHSVLIYTLMNILLGLGFNGHFIALHDQALARQLLSGQKSIPGLHGSFSLGTLFTAVLSISITSRVSLAWHIDILIGVLWVATTLSIIRTQQFLIRGSTYRQAAPPIRVKNTWSMLTKDRYISLAYVCAVMVEFSTNDWVTLLSRQEVRANRTLSIIPFLIFIIGMVVGRLGFHKLLMIKPEEFWIRISSRTGGIGFIVFLLLAKYFSERNFTLAFTCETLAFFIGGLGGSFLAGVLTQIASERSHLPGGVVVAQLSFALTIITFFVKLLISSVIQVSSITLGLMIPGVLMITLSFFTKLGSR